MCDASLCGASSDKEPCTQSSSIIECENQTLMEAVPIRGTPLQLVYRSDRTPVRNHAVSVRLWQDPDSRIFADSLLDDACGIACEARRANLHRIACASLHPAAPAPNPGYAGGLSEPLAGVDHGS